MTARSSNKRSAVKAISYRAVIIVLDFLAVYLLTGKTGPALGFMIISNIYTTVCYFLHERIWERIQWGKEQTPITRTQEALAK